MDSDFTWRDAERTVRFARGAILEAPQLLGDGYTLLSTPRARATQPQLEAAAAQVVDVAPGFVDQIAGQLLAAGPLTNQLVALGGGRVIDTAKALGAAAGEPTLVAAIPTTLSAAEMTSLHRQAVGAPRGSTAMRPQLVINDPTLSASQPMPQLAASAANALAHAVEGAVTGVTSPLQTLAALRAVTLLAQALPAEGEPDRDALALAALLSGYAIDCAGLHHVMSQTLVRETGVGHGNANAAMLPTTSAALRQRRGDAIAAVDDAAGMPIEELASRFAQLAQAPSLQAIGVDEALLPHCAELASGRSELALTPPPASADELLELYRAAW